MENDVLYNRIMNVVHEEYGEGSTAVANPEGEPTDDLTSIQIGDEIYGIANAGGGDQDRLFEVHYDENTYTLDKTWQEIFDAIEDGKIPFYISSSESSGFKLASFNQCNRAMLEEGTYSVFFYSVTIYDGVPTIEGEMLSTDSENGYPSLL